MYWVLPCSFSHPKAVSSQSAIDRWPDCIGPDRDIPYLGIVNKIQGNYYMLVVSVIVFQLYKENLNDCLTSYRLWKLHKGENYSRESDLIEIQLLV